MYKHKSGAEKRKLKKEKEIRGKKGQECLESLGFRLTSQIENKGEVSDAEYHKQDDFSRPSTSKQNVKYYTGQKSQPNAENASSNSMDMGK